MITLFIRICKSLAQRRGGGIIEITYHWEGDFLIPDLNLDFRN